MSATSTISTPSSPNSSQNFCVPPPSEQDCGGRNGSRQEAFNKLREYVRSIDNRSDVERYDPYKRFVALCREFHGHRTKKGHSFHAKKLRWLWYCSNGKNRAFENLWNTESVQRTRHRNDELGITVRCLSGGFTQAETEAVIKAWWKHNGEGFDFMVMLVYRSITFERALKVTASIREQHQRENDKKYWSKTANRILWAVEKFGDAGATPKEIAEAIAKDVQTVKQRLIRLCKDGQTEKIRHGVYRLAAKQDREAAPATTRPAEQSPMRQDEAVTVVDADDLNDGDTNHATVERPLRNPGCSVDGGSQEAFIESVIEYDDFKEAEQKVIDRFYRLAKEYATGQSNKLPKHLDQQLAAFKSAWDEHHSGESSINTT